MRSPAAPPTPWNAIAPPPARMRSAAPNGESDSALYTNVSLFRPPIRMSGPAPPIRMSLPARPLRVLPMALPVIELARPLPVPVVATPNITRFSRLAPRVRLTLAFTRSVPPAAPPTVSTVVSPALSTK